MNRESLDLLAHPVRLRLAAALIANPLTPRQLAAALPAIPQASLYRHLKELLDAGVVEVVAEQAVNGATERTYRVVQPSLSQADFREASRDDHLHFFNVFLLTLIDSYTAYIHQADLEQLFAEGLSYRLAVVHLSEEELARLSHDFTALMQPLLNQEPTPERKPYTLASILIPERD